MLSRNKTLRDSASDVADQLRPHVEEARKKAAPALAEARNRAEEARAKAEPALREAAAKARTEGSKAAKEARDAASPYLADARRTVEPALDEARKRVAPVIEEARSKAAPVIDEVRSTAAPLAEGAWRRAEDLYDERVLPTVATALTLADDATADIRHEAGRRGSAAVAALKGEVTAPPERHRGRNLVVALGLAGVAGFVAKKLGDRQAAAAWESAYTTNPPRPARPQKAGDDIGGGNPGEAVADGAVQPHPATTPDSPAETVEVRNRDAGPSTPA